jgi:hypothetical protein
MNWIAFLNIVSGKLYNKIKKKTDDIVYDIEHYVNTMLWFRHSKKRSGLITEIQLKLHRHIKFGENYILFYELQSLHCNIWDEAIIMTNG